MKSLLCLARLWQRLLVWLLAVFLCYIPLVAVACAITDSRNSELHTEAIWSLPESFFVFAAACMLAPAIAIVVELLAFLLPGRIKMNTTDYLVCMLAPARYSWHCSLGTVRCYPHIRFLAGGSCHRWLGCHCPYSAESCSASGGQAAAPLGANTRSHPDQLAVGAVARRAHWRHHRLLCLVR